MGERNLELAAARPRPAPQPAEDDHRPLGLEQLVGLGPETVDVLVEDLDHRDHPEVTVVSAAPRHGFGEGPLDVVGDRPGELVGVLALEGGVDPLHGLGRLVGHRPTVC